MSVPCIYLERAQEGGNQVCTSAYKVYGIVSIKMLILYDLIQLSP